MFSFRLKTLGKAWNSLFFLIEIVSLLFFYKDGFGIKYPTKVDMQSSKEITTRSTWPSDGILTGINTLAQGGPKIDGNEGILPIPLISIRGSLPSDAYSNSRQQGMTRYFNFKYMTRWYFLVIFICLPHPSYQIVFSHPYSLVYIDIKSSSCHAISTDIPDPLSPHLPIVQCFQQILRATSCIGTELLYVGLSWTSCLCSSL